MCLLMKLEAMATNNRGVGNRPAAGKGNNMRHPNDFYPTPSRLTEHLLRHVAISGRILEPCAGDGAISGILSNHIHVNGIMANDIDRERGWWFQDAADILAGTLEFLRDKGFSIGLRNADANAKRRSGLMIFIADLRLNDDGAIFAESEPVPQNGIAEPA